jgi:hypothetical protein
MFEIDALLALVGLLLLGVFWCGVWQEVCTDIARQYIFERRDMLFDVAAEGRLSFKSREYREVRAHLESLIRFAHDLNFSHFLLYLFFVKDDGDGRAKQVWSLIDDIQDERAKHVAAKAVTESVRMLMTMVVMKSVLGLVLIPIAAIMAVAAYLQAKALDRVLVSALSIVAPRQTLTTIGRKIENEARAAF